ncbi:MmcQ/YjbR family DNA-binding protein [Paenibacillus sp. CF384]|uniref:MmcQ/YjbR family DNA-binding protein n=1 Tax=Paenibacillus sp. CF384 TaxID=1884382 RepID=UPI00089A173A|nr:MmcQ/YjbR family DNA-binding protein [Paenibacillus sp. CF384]SDW18993.1 YjbR protein [Paenibacillus sp. CF384]
MNHPIGMQTPEGIRMLEQVRQICSSLPETTEIIDGHGHTTFKVKDKSFIIMSDYGMTFKSDLENQEIIVQQEQFFIPKYIGHRGWVGVNSPSDWDQMGILLTEAYLHAAPKRLIKQFMEQAN